MNAPRYTIKIENSGNTAFQVYDDWDEEIVLYFPAKVFGLNRAQALAESWVKTLNDAGQGIIRREHIKIGGQSVLVESKDNGYFKGTIGIAGVPHHVELIEVVDNDVDNDCERIQRARFPEGEEHFNAIGAFSPNERMQTIDLAGGKYLCAITPFAE